MMRKKVRALKYNAIFQTEDEGGYSVWIPDLPGCTSQGETFEEAKKNIQEAIELYLEGEENEEFSTPDPRKQFMATVDARIHA